MFLCYNVNATYCFANWMEMSSSNSPTEAISYGFHSPDGVATTATTTHYNLCCIVYTTDGRLVERFCIRFSIAENDYFSKPR